MADITKLKQIAKEKDMNLEQLAEEIGINRATMYRKIAKDGEVFTLKEAKKISRVLGLSIETASDIFFAN